MTVTLTPPQRAALTLIADNPGRVIAWQRWDTDGYLTINGHVENGFARGATKGFARAILAETRTDSRCGETYEVKVWQITPAGREALAAQ